jgi:hypothetical protein
MNCSLLNIRNSEINKSDNDLLLLLLLLLTYVLYMYMNFSLIASWLSRYHQLNRYCLNGICCLFFVVVCVYMWVSFGLLLVITCILTLAFGLLSC